MKSVVCKCNAYSWSTWCEDYGKSRLNKPNNCPDAHTTGWHRTQGMSDA